MAAPKPKALWPIVVTAGVNDRIDFAIGGTPYVATIPPGSYVMLVRNVPPGEVTSLGTAVAAAMEAASPDFHNLVVDQTTGRVTLTGTTPFTIQWATGPNVARSIGPTLGFAVSDDAVAGGSHVSEYQHQNGWYAPDPVQDDTGDLGEFTRVQSVSLWGNVRGFEFAARDLRTILLAHVPAAKAYIADESSALNEALERLIRSGWTRFRWWPDATVDGTWKDYALDIETAKQIPRRRLSPVAAYYDFTLRMRPYL